MDDTDVRAPITGTIISKTVERGQVISSPTRDVGGGSVLLKMADLDLVQVRTLVDETDIGKIRAGLAASVVVDAYPNQPFQGQVLKIEPQAETQNNVTMFPVLIRIENRNGLLKPGMNADVDLQVGKRDSVLAIPNAALRTQRDVNSAAQVLGIDSTRFQELMKVADAVRDSARTQAASPGGPADAAQKADSAKAEPRGETLTTPDGREVQLPPGISAAQVRELFRKRFSGGTLTPQEQATMQTVTRSFGGRGGMRPRSGGGGSDYQFGGNYIVFVDRNGQPTPVHIRTGLTDLDYSEVVSGLKDGDSVIILPSASLVQSQQEFKQRISSFNQGVPGMRQQTAQGPAGATAARPAQGGPR
jgi:HlyD family secretion protein